MFTKYYDTFFTNSKEKKNTLKKIHQKYQLLLSLRKDIKLQRTFLFQNINSFPGNP